LATRPDDRLQAWIEQLERRHLAELTFAEVSRALRALSSGYVERRGRLSHGAALSGAGKRAAFALFYGPLHYLLIREIIRALPGASDNVRSLVDLGCGTGASGAAWAASCDQTPRIIAVDRHPWAIAEAAETYRTFGYAAQVRRGDISKVALPKGPASFVAAFTLNELPDQAREDVVGRLIERARRGDRLLIVEPLAGFVAPWWDGLRERVVAGGGRADQWRFRLELPAIVAKLDRATGLDHRELTGRSLWIQGPTNTGQGHDR
jgi:SAM-dependent methyltransferase